MQGRRGAEPRHILNDHRGGTSLFSVHQVTCTRFLSYPEPHAAVNLLYVIIMNVGGISCMFSLDVQEFPHLGAL